jgi:hypothetical protein
MATRINWHQHVKAWQGGGLSQAAYCRLHRLSPATFSAKIRALGASPPPLPVATGLVPVQVGLADIPAIALAADSPPITADSVSVPTPGLAVGGPLVLHTASGHRLELPASAAPRWVAELLRCLG